ncbi:MAG: hypothetical protein JKY54_13590, partial [Flavobacteriales bacterium]|nr:hypothetical protein [Flavobacteriales bacterium]
GAATTSPSYLDSAHRGRLSDENPNPTFKVPVHVFACVPPELREHAPNRNMKLATSASPTVPVSGVMLTENYTSFCRIEDGERYNVKNALACAQHIRIYSGIGHTNGASTLAILFDMQPEPIADTKWWQRAEWQMGSAIYPKLAQGGLPATAPVTKVYRVALLGVNRPSFCKNAYFQQTFHGRIAGAKAVSTGTARSVSKC